MKAIRALLAVLAVVAVLFFIQKREYSKVGVVPFSSLVPPPPGMVEPVNSRLKFLEKLAPGGRDLAKGFAWTSHGMIFIQVDVPASSASGLHFHDNVRIVLDDSSYLYARLSGLVIPDHVPPGFSLYSPVDSYYGRVPPGRSIAAVEVLAIIVHPGVKFPKSTADSFPELSGPVVRDLQRKGARIVNCPVGSKPAPPKFPPSPSLLPPP